MERAPGDRPPRLIEASVEQGGNAPVMRG